MHDRDRDPQPPGRGIVSFEGEREIVLPIMQTPIERRRERLCRYNPGDRVFGEVSFVSCALLLRRAQAGHRVVAHLDNFAQ